MMAESDEPKLNDPNPGEAIKAEPAKKADGRKRKVEPKFDAKSEPVPDAKSEPAFDAKPEPTFDAAATPEVEAKATLASVQDARRDAKSGPAVPPERDEARANHDDDAGKALAPAGPAPIDPFLAAKAKENVERAPPPRSFASRLLDYSAHIAIIVGLIGFAWTVSGYVINRPKTDDAATTAKASAGKRDEMGELRLANIKMHEEIRALKSSVDALRTASRRDTTPEQVRMLSAGLDNIKGSLASARSETSSAIAQLQGKVDKLSAGKMQGLADRIGRLERGAVDTSATASISRAEPTRETGRQESVRQESVRQESARQESMRQEPVRQDSKRQGTARQESTGSPVGDQGRTPPKPPVKPAELANLESKDAASEDKPQIIQGWVVRDVYQGVALIEGKRGQIEVVPGVSIPGAGVVKSIERKGGGWVVTTSKGQLAYAGASAQREQRDHRRGGYGYGGGYGRGGYYRDDY